ncbi:FIST N-terminal domain-containing protein [Sorangium sp. So ce1036]|uniref:FIST signal transduction protein n=1 Tax=Sorangium sp. So ce1036 TaxID=3133328 RepID=UPI003F03987F
MKMMTLGPFEGNAWLLGRKIERAVAEWRESARLALVAMPSGTRHEEYLAAIEDATGVPVVGATTGGASFTERGFSRSGISCAFLGGAHLEVACGAARELRADHGRSIRAALSDIDEAHSSSGPRSAAPSSMLVLADAFACDGDELATCLRQGVPPHTRVFGGTAGDAWSFEGGARVFVDRKALTDAAVLVRLTHRHRVNIDVLHGFRAAEGARDLTITDIERNVLRTLDGQPAARVYEEELTRLGLRSSGEGLLQTMAKHALGARTPFGEALKIRAPLAVRADGAVVLTGGLSRGQMVRIVNAPGDSLLQAAKSLSTRVLGSLPAVSGALVFDCASRLRLLGEHYREEVRALLSPSAPSHPTFGMTCYGQIAKFGGSVEAFHNTSAVMAAWSEADQGAGSPGA